MAKDATLAQVMSRPKKSGHGRRTEAYVWLRKRFEKLSPRLRDKPGWRGLAEDMTAGGIKGGGGKPLTDLSVMRIWSRVCQDIAAEEPRRMEAVQIAMRGGGVSQKQRPRELKCGANADQPPPVVTAPAPRPPVPSYPPPPQTRRRKQNASHSRPNAPSAPTERLQTAEEMLADLTETINRRSGRY